MTHETMPSVRGGTTRKFEVPYKLLDGTVTTMSVYFSFSCYPDGRIGEVFIKAGKSGELASGALDAVATVMSMALQRGVVLDDLLPKIRHMRFEPQGFTGAADFPSCSSVLDLLAQWLAHRFPAGKLCPDPDGHKALANRDKQCEHCFTDNDGAATWIKDP